MDFNFKKFEGRNVKTETRITITKSYTIGFPTKFYEDNKISEYKYAVLYWDEERLTIGLQFTNDNEEKSKFWISRSKKYGGSIVAKSFFKANGIEPKEYTGKYEWEKVNVAPIGEVYAVTLRKNIK